MGNRGRTYLSTGGRRCYTKAQCDRGIVAGFSPARSLEAKQRLAEKEAHRILADVEPRDGTFADTWKMHGTHAPAWAIRCNKEGDALGDSLTAFLAAPDPAAWLRDRQ